MVHTFCTYSVFNYLDVGLQASMRALGICTTLSNQQVCMLIEQHEHISKYAPKANNGKWCGYVIWHLYLLANTEYLLTAHRSVQELTMLLLIFMYSFW